MHAFHPSDSQTRPLWLPTGQAARVLRRSADTLKRYAKRDGFLVEGEHWGRGAHPNSPWVWNIPSCEAALLWHGRIKRHQP